MVKALWLRWRWKKNFSGSLPVILTNRSIFEDKVCCGQRETMPRQWQISEMIVHATTDPTLPLSGQGLSHGPHKILHLHSALTHLVLHLHSAWPYIWDQDGETIDCRFVESKCQKLNCWTQKVNFFIGWYWLGHFFPFNLQNMRNMRGKYGKDKSSFKFFFDVDESGENTTLAAPWAGGWGELGGLKEGNFSRCCVFVGGDSAPVWSIRKP